MKIPILPPIYVFSQNDSISKRYHYDIYDYKFFNFNYLLGFKDKRQVGQTHGCLKSISIMKLVNFCFKQISIKKIMQ